MHQGLLSVLPCPVWCQSRGLYQTFLHRIRKPFTIDYFLHCLSFMSAVLCFDLLMGGFPLPPQPPPQLFSRVLSVGRTIFLSFNWQTAVTRTRFHFTSGQYLFFLLIWNTYLCTTWLKCIGGKRFTRIRLSEICQKKPKNLTILLHQSCKCLIKK